MRSSEPLEPRQHLAAGFFDNSFGGDGAVGLPGEGIDVSLAPGGRPVVLTHNDESGIFRLRRFDSRGRVDSSFAFDTSLFNQFHVNGDGSLLLSAGLKLQRFNADLSVDESFASGNGSIRISGSERFTVDALGRIYSFDGVTVRRYHVDGRLDPRWSGDGIALVGLQAGFDGEGEVIAVLPQASGRVIVAVAANQSTADDASRFVALTARGNVIRSFGRNGVTDAGRARSFSGLVSDAQGGLYLGETTDDSEVYLKHFFADGRRDDGFGEPQFLGNAVRLIADSQYSLNDLLIDSEGRLILIGSGDLRRGADLVPGTVVYRLNPDGTPDTSFNYDGRLDFGHATDGKHVIAFAGALDGRGGLFIAADDSPFQFRTNLLKINLNGAAPPLFTLSSTGTLRVVGNSPADDISIYADGSDTLVHVNGDFARVTGVKQIVVDAGAGEDAVTVTSSKPATLIGGAGNDFLSAFAPGVITGGDGNDTLRADDAPHAFQGGRGFDTVSYAGRSENLVIRLDNLPNDGARGESDNVHSDIEEVIAGSGRDLLVGGPGAQLLRGGDNHDTLFGGDGDDTLRGEGGRDVLDGQSGDDELVQ